MEVHNSLPSPLSSMFFFCGPNCLATLMHLLPGQLGPAIYLMKQTAFHLLLGIALKAAPTRCLSNEQLSSPMESLLSLSRQQQVVAMLLFQLCLVYVTRLLWTQLFSIAPAPNQTTSPLQDLTSPLPAAPGRDIPWWEDFVPGGNMPGGYMPGGPDTAWKSPQVRCVPVLVVTSSCPCGAASCSCELDPAIWYHKPVWLGLDALVARTSLIPVAQVPAYVSSLLTSGATFVNIYIVTPSYHHVNPSYLRLGYITPTRALMQNFS